MERIQVEEEETDRAPDGRGHWSTLATTTLQAARQSRLETRGISGCVALRAAASLPCLLKLKSESVLCYSVGLSWSLVAGGQGANCKSGMNPNSILGNMV